MGKTHEALVQQQMEALAPNIAFLELEIVADAVASQPVDSTPGFHATHVREKMSKYALIDRTTPDMARGMVGAAIVRNSSLSGLAWTP